MIGASDINLVRANMTMECPGHLDEPAGARHLVCPQDVEDHDVAGRPLLSQHLFEERLECFGLGCLAPLMFPWPYSPEQNPTDLCWGKLKSIPKESGARAQQALDRAIRTTTDPIGIDDAVARFTHCGCGAQVK